MSIEWVESNTCGPPALRVRLNTVGSRFTTDVCKESSGSSSSVGPLFRFPSRSDQSKPMSRSVPSEKSRSS